MKIVVIGGTGLIGQSSPPSWASKMWPTYYALETLTTADEAKIAKLVKRAVT
jgi:hypothetical protein